MIDADRFKLLFGPYDPPALRPGRPSNPSAIARLGLSLPNWDMTQWDQKRKKPASLVLPGLCPRPYPADSPYGRDL